ncbi:hypothetical protein OIU84_008336 [Salix udensis]|uniref:Uncharacterized protein n=1 Tax=Salix udensis TaxID=889485 RepID=A0AAD6JV48_9ROSI|nr:hypothetical protein OIU84_008336 [Salix udensis]
MELWIALNHDCVRDQLKVLASEVRKHERRLQSSEYGVDEHCIYCSESFTFDSPEVAHCQCSNSTDKTVQIHQMARCVVSMQVCPAIPLWFCKCCCRIASKLPPETLFTLSGYPLDFKSLTKSSVKEIPTKPLCPFCGIPLQRLQPDFYSHLHQYERSFICIFMTSNMMSSYLFYELEKQEAN